MDARRNCLYMARHALTDILVTTVSVLALVMLLAGCAPVVAPVVTPVATDAATADASMFDEAECDAPSHYLFIGWAPDTATDAPIAFDSIGSDFEGSARDWLDPTIVISDVSPLDGATLSSLLNKSTIGFLTAHGNPTALAGTNVSFSDLNLGACNESEASPLRYLLLASCNTLAHGPDQCQPRVPASGPEELYACPGAWTYDSDGDRVDLRNVYERWGRALGEGMRMVCGGSTDLTPGSAAGVWKGYPRQSTSIADAFLGSISYKRFIGLCLARGGLEFADSPLMKDQAFTTEANPYDNLPADQVFFHLQYSLPFTTPYEPIQGVLNGDKQMSQVLADLQSLSEVSPTCAPVLPVAGNNVGEQLLRGQNEKLERHPSQAAAVGGEEELAERERSYINSAAEIARGIDLPFTLRPDYAQGVHILLSTFPTDQAAWSAEAFSVTEKNVTIRFPQFVRVDEAPLGDFDRDTFILALQDFNKAMRGLYEGQPGAGYQEPVDEGDPAGEEMPLLPLREGNVTVRLNQDFTTIGYSYSTPVIGFDAQMPLQTVSPYDAYLQSLQQAYNIDDEDIVNAIEGQYGSFDDQPLRLDAWSWGYSQFHNGEYRPDALFLTYRFEFGPNVEAGYSAETHPPRSFSVDGQTNIQCR